MKKAVTRVLLAFFIALFIFSGWKVVEIVSEYTIGEGIYASLEQYVSYPEYTPVETVTKTEPTQPAVTEASEEVQSSVHETLPEEETVWPTVDFDQLTQINPDIVGWIYIEGTDINYPIVQGSDNDYYLTHLFDGTYNRSGSIFLDADCSSDFSDVHSIIYGHHMKNQTMFSGLMEYKQQEYYDEHTSVLLLTPLYNYKVYLFSGYVTDNLSGAWDREFKTGEFADWISEVTERSVFTSESYPGNDDRILTLSTCSYEFDDAKFVLHGYIIQTVNN